MSDSTCLPLRYIGRATKRWIAILIIAGLFEGPSLFALTLSLDFSTTGGSVLDQAGKAVGFTGRLPGTGASIAPNDPSLNLQTNLGALTLTTTPGDFHGQVTMNSISAPGLNLSDLGFTGGEDFSVTASFSGIPDNSVVNQVDQLGIFVGTASTNHTRAGMFNWDAFNPMQARSNEGYGVNTTGDWDSSPRFFGTDVGTNMFVEISRTGGVWRVFVNGIDRMPNTSANGSGSPVPPVFLNSQSELMVGVFAMDMGGDSTWSAKLDQFTVTVSVEPHAIVEPENHTVFVGGDTDFHFQFNQSSSYQWFLGNNPILGATNSTLVLSNALPTDAGGYWAIATNFSGSFTSRLASLTVLPLDAPAPEVVFYYRDSIVLEGLFGWNTVSTYTNQGFEFPISDEYQQGAYPLFAPGVMRGAKFGGRVGHNQMDIAWQSRIAGNGPDVFAYIWHGIQSFMDVEVWIRNEPNLVAVVDNLYSGHATVSSPNMPVDCIMPGGAGVSVYPQGTAVTNFVKQWSDVSYVMTNFSTARTGLTAMFPTAAYKKAAGYGTHEIGLLATSGQLGVPWTFFGQGDFTNHITVHPVRLNVVGWGVAPFPALLGVSPFPVPLELTNAVQLASGEGHNLAIRGDGGVAAWGNNGAGQTTLPMGLNDVTALAAGLHHSLALKGDHSIVAWGGNTNGQATVPVDLGDVVQIAAGYYHNLALQRDGTVVAWGLNDFGQTNVPPGLSNVVAIAGGEFHSVALRSDGSLIAWGNNVSGQTNIPAGASNVVALAVGKSHCLALRSDGTVVAWGNPSVVPGGLTNVMSLAAGRAHDLALLDDGSLVAWGDNSAGQTSLPSISEKVVSISAAGDHSAELIGVGVPFANDSLADRFARQGEQVLWHVEATGEWPLSYQWRKNGTNIVGATSSTFLQPNVQPGDTGAYSVAVVNGKGTTVTAQGQLTVTPAPVATPPLLLLGQSGRLGDGRFQLGISNTTASLLEVLASTNLAQTNWSIIGTLSNESLFIDPATNYPERYYRLRAVYP